MNSRFIMNVNNKDAQNNVAVNNSDYSDAKPQIPKEKLISYEEKSVGSTTFFQCDACPYMAFAEDDIKFHLFTVHPQLAKSSGLADNVQISCPGCTCIFDTEETLRTHLRTHHKMGVKDVRKMVKSLVQIALKNAKLKKEDTTDEPLPPPKVNCEKLDVKMPQLIEIVPNVSTSDSLPQGVAFISVDELQKMSTPNFNKVDPKEIIQEASINIVYANDIPTQYVNVADTTTPTSSCNVIKLSNATPDLISSIQPCVGTDSKILLQSVIENVEPQVDHTPKLGRPPGSRKSKTTGQDHGAKIEKHQDLGTSCMVNNCCIRLKDPEKLAYHRKCHLEDNLQCPECAKVYTSANPLHTHLWKSHGVDLELPTCEICGFKTSKKHRLYNIHMKCHKNIRLFECPVCGKLFKNASQLSKHKLTHKTSNVARCSICQLEFSTQRKLTVHVKAVHEKVKPFKCCQCNYKAARKEEIKLHMRSHTGDKPYSCNQCSYRSADHNAMRRHRKRHSNESLYKCKFCSYSTIQSTVFASHMISKHPNVKSNDIFRCPYCPFKSVNKDKYVIHLTTHTDKEGIQLLIEMTQNKNTKPSWTIPSEAIDKPPEQDAKGSNEQNEGSSKSLNTIPIEVYDCDSLSESLPQNYSKSYCTASDGDVQQTEFNSSIHVTDLSKDDNNSDLISESSNDTLIERHRFTPQHTLTNITYDNAQSNLHGFLNTSVPMEQSLLQNDSGSSIVSNHSSNIMSNFPIRLPSPQISMQNNVIYRQIDKISVPMKVIGIKPNGRICVGHDGTASSSSSPINMSNEPDTPPRKKPKISVKSNLILKGPDAVNMFHSQQKLAFKRLEDHERFGLESPVTFNNLMTTQFMQLQQQEPELSESPSDIMPYKKNLMDDTAATPESSGINNDAQMFSFSSQMNVNSMTILPPPQKIQSNDPSYIKIEATIKQNTQSPSLERMCTANIPQRISLEYKASPPLEDIHKNINEIKNEMKSDSYYSMPLNNADSNPSLIDQYLIDGGLGEQYLGHMDLSSVVLSEINDDQQNDVIEIDDNSDDNKMLPRFDMNFPLESLYLMHNDFHFLDTEMSANNLPSDNVNEINRMVNEVPIVNSKDSVNLGPPKSDFHNAVNCKKDPMINTTVRPCTNKINVKNIELMKN